MAAPQSPDQPDHSYETFRDSMALLRVKIIEHEDGTGEFKRDLCHWLSHSPSRGSAKIMSQLLFGHNKAIPAGQRLGCCEQALLAFDVMQRCEVAEAAAQGVPYHENWAVNQMIQDATGDMGYALAEILDAEPQATAPQ